MSRSLLTAAALALGSQLALSAALAEGEAEPEPAWESRGEIALEGRVFEGDQVASTNDEGAGVATRLEAKRFSGALDLKGRVFGRVDHWDPTRSQVFVEEAWGGTRSGDWSLRVGPQLLTWTATEAFHPADIINSRNLDSNLEYFEKIGEPMALGGWSPGGWTVQGLLMPARLDPYLPQPSSRLSFAPEGVTLGEALWLTRSGEVTRRNYGLQWGARVARSLEGADVALHLVRHDDRSQPVIVVDPATGAFHPLYLPVTQLGGTYQHALGGVLLKIESAYRWFELPDAPTVYGPIERSNHGILAVGLEYGWSHDSGSESTALIEGQAVAGAGDAERAALSPFQRDVLVGWRHAFNDELGRELLATLVWDLERTREHLINLSYSQRLSDVWGMKVAARRIHAPPEGAVPTGLQALHRANQLALTLTRYF